MTNLEAWEIGPKFVDLKRKTSLLQVLHTLTGLLRQAIATARVDTSVHVDDSFAVPFLQERH